MQTESIDSQSPADAEKFCGIPEPTVERVAEGLLALVKAGLGGGLAAFSGDGQIVESRAGILDVDNLGGAFEARIPSPDPYSEEELHDACEIEARFGIERRRAIDSEILWSCLIERGGDAKIRAEAGEVDYREDEGRRAWLRRLASESA